MAKSTAALTTTGPLRPAPPVSDAAQTWLVVLTSAIFVGGVYLDGWAHNHGKVDGSFFTPWHAVLYAGFGATVAALVAPLVLLVAGRWSLPLGSLTPVLTLNAALVSFLNDQFLLVPAAAGAGIAADLLVRRLRPFEASSLVATRLLALAVPAVLYSAYFSALAITQGIGWTVHLWAGSVVLAGIVGWLLSYLATSQACGDRPTEGPLLIS